MSSDSSDKIGLRRLTELPNDRKFRVLVWLGQIVLSPEKKEPKIRVAFREFDPYATNSSMFGSNGFHSYYQKEGDFERKKYYPFEILEIGIGL
ncbi:MAG TPA: hypothetical protein VIT44_01125, partial [Cyclobacteriaceae bacterium]